MKERITDSAQYKEKIYTIFPNAKIIKLKGYTNGNTDYDEAKKPVGSWQKSRPLETDEEINGWVKKGGWLGVRIPEKRYVVDVDDNTNGEMLKDLLESENVHHHAINTPNGWQFVFKCEAEATRKEGQYQKYVNRLGITQDTRAPGKGYIVFPTENTKNRFVATESLNELNDLPPYLFKVWNGQKIPSPMAYPYETSGARNGDFYDLARRLFTCGVSKEDIEESLRLAYEYLVIDKQDFSFNEVQKSIKSAMQKVKPNGKAQPTVGEKNNYKAIPKPYIVGPNATLYEEKEDKDGNITTIFVSRKTPYITKEFHNVERPQVFYGIEWNEKSRTVKEVVPASTISLRKELLEMSEKGFSVNENNVKRIIQFFDLYLLINNIDQSYAVERLGAIKDKFIHPLMSNGVEIIALDHGEKQIKEGFEVKGTTESWKNEVFERIKDCPKAVFFVLASFTSVILNDLHMTPFIVDLSGTTSQGKTTTLKVAVSVWGNENLMGEWNATKVSIERKSAYLNSFPLMLDDTRKADEKTLKHIVYQFSGGRSKGRGTLKGSQREYTWNNILLSTGEVSLNEYASREGGAAARIIPIEDEPLKRDHDNIVRLNEAIENHYGAVGIEFLRVWFENKAELMEELPKFKNYYFEKSKGNEVLTRIANYYATVHFVGSILKTKLRLDIDLKAISDLFDEITNSNKAVDKPRQFLEEILTDLDSSRKEIYYEYEPATITKAIYKNGSLYLMPAYLSRFLGIEEKATRREWLKKGFTIGEQKSTSYVDYKAIKHKGKTYRVIPLNMEFVKELGFSFELDPFMGG